MLLRVGGHDPSLRNWGLAKGTLDTVTGELVITEIRLQETDKETGKTVRQSSDDLRCASLLSSAVHLWNKDCDAVFAEVPSGSQSARGSFSNGICLGVLGGIGPSGNFNGRLIQVNPTEVKRAAVGSKNAAKHEIIEWAMGNWPNLPWPLVQRNSRNLKKGDLDEARAEHMADACAAINAGVQTDEFKSIIQIVEAMAARSGQVQNLAGDQIVN